MHLKFVSFLFLLFFTSSAIKAESDLVANGDINIDKIDAINNYVHFTNEGIHGMLVAVKLLENFNLDINKYVDLASYKINNYSNDDLPRDIFEDPDHWFYDVTPYEWYDKIQSNTTAFAQKPEMDKLAARLKTTLTNINKVRLDLEPLIKNNDLTQEVNLRKVYDKLEEAVTLYQDFFIVQRRMDSIIKEISSSLEQTVPRYEELYTTLNALYQSSKACLLAERDKDMRTFNKVLPIQQDAFMKFSNLGSAQNLPTDSKFKFNWNGLKNAANGISTSFQKFQSSPDVTEQYKIYGQFYFYYNVSSLSKFNKYGTGIVSGINNVINLLKLPKVAKMELPHYFKVIYPQKLEKVEFVESEVKEIVTLPTKIKDRKVGKTKKRIRVTSDVVEFKFFDHMIADGDIASVSYNGDWIMEKEELELAPKTFKIKLNRQGRNYLLLHADNIGTRPPCTIGVSYFMGNTKKEIILKSDDNVSELIEIEIIQ